jgi:hypothetical protein
LDLDDTYQIDPACELRFLAQAILGLLRRHERRDMTEIELICPTSGAIFHNDGRSSTALKKATSNDASSAK